MTKTSDVVVAALLALVTVGCGGKAKEGEACKTEGKLTCLDKQSALVCVDGKWEKMGCRGIAGCMGMMGNATCNNQGYREGEPCPGKEGNPECSEDKKAMLKCTAKHWQKLADCNGQHGCVANAKGARCDKGTEEEGAACTAANEGAGSCSPDKQSLLKCTGGKMTFLMHCRGQHGCRQMGRKLECDNSIALVGDPCDPADVPPFACAPDKRSMLRCKDGKMVKDRSCKRCNVFLDKIDCVR